MHNMILLVVCCLALFILFWIVTSKLTFIIIGICAGWFLKGTYVHVMKNVLSHPEVHR